MGMWCTSDLTYKKRPSINESLSDILFGNFNSESDALPISWFDNSANSVTLADETVLFTLVFNVVGDNSSVSMLNFSICNDSK